MIPFNKPNLRGKEIKYIREAVKRGQLSGDGRFTFECQEIIKKLTNATDAFLTHSCTAALEIVALLIDLKKGDEVIMPSYTFVSTANAFCLRGATPIFVDIRQDTLNLDENLVENAITEKTKAIVGVHYAGVACAPDKLKKIADENGILFIEDAAQALGSTFHGKPLGSFGDFSAISFHETKNVISGEGGALIINNDKYVKRAEVIREKGTDRSSFLRGERAMYTWQDLGSSFLPSELIAAFLLAQLEDVEEITKAKLEIWRTYHQNFKSLEEKGLCKRPVVPSGNEHNGHFYYILLEDEKQRNAMIQHLLNHGIHSVFHYIPLHSSPAGLKYGRAHGKLKNTEMQSKRLLRLPSWIGLESINKICTVVSNFFSS
jgi:dTDP-4-amino-4,6-dideoxygalactose transaminase